MPPRSPAAALRKHRFGMMDLVVAPWLRRRADITKIITAKRIGYSLTIPPRLSITKALCAKKNVSVIHAIPKIAITPVIPAEKTLLLAIFPGCNLQVNTMMKDVRKAMISIALGIDR